MNISLKGLFLFLILTGFAIPQAHAVNPIIRPYQSVRSAAMGGVRITTGLYDENFFNNPARVTANPESKFTIFQLTPVEVTPDTLRAINQIRQGTDALDVVTNNSGNNIHDRVQLIFPAYYLATKEDRKWALAIGFIASIQADSILHKGYEMDIGAIADIGPAVTYGRTFLPEDKLSAGITAHMTYRAATTPSYGLIDYVRGVPISFNSIAGDGSMINFDLGSTYKLTKWNEFDLSVGAAIQNILGGNYSHSLMSLANTPNGPLPQLRSYGFGISGTRPDWWKFKNTVFAFEVTDILNSPNGSLFKLLHLGGETHWRKLAFRLGLNQGYISGGFGLDLHYFTLNMTTYGEELSLNAGIQQDRRYTFDIGFHI